MTLDVYNCKTNVRVASKTGSFLSKLVQCTIGDYQGFEIEFEPSFALKANTQYQIDASITGPPSWYGQGGVSFVESSGVTFLFSDISPKRTTVSMGQFAEFLFAVD